MRGNPYFRFLDRYIGRLLILLLAGTEKIRQIFRNPPLVPNPQRILIIKLSALGDTILLTPFLKSLRQTFPNSRISFLLTTVNQAAVKDCPYLDEIILLPLAEYIRKPLHFFHFLRRLRSNHFEWVFDCDQWLRLSPLLAVASGANQRVGFQTTGQGRHYLYTRIVLHQPNQHERDCFLKLLEVCSVPVISRETEFWIPARAKDEVNVFLKKNNLTTSGYILIHPGCGNHGYPREWGVEKYQELIRWLKEKGWPVILSGGESEAILLDRISDAIIPPPFLFKGYPLPFLAELLHQARLLICGNTGIMHLAVAVKTPVVAIHGPTDQRKWGPADDRMSRIVRANLACSPCLYLGYEYGCFLHTCMDCITGEIVKESVQELLAIPDRQKKSPATSP